MVEYIEALFDQNSSIFTNGTFFPSRKFLLYPSTCNLISHDMGWSPPRFHFAYNTLMRVAAMLGYVLLSPIFIVLIY